MINFKISDFCKLLRLCAKSVLQISKKHFATFDFFVKMKLVSLWYIKRHNPNLVTHSTKMGADKLAENTPKCPKIYLLKLSGQA